VCVCCNGSRQPLSLSLSLSRSGVTTPAKPRAPRTTAIACDTSRKTSRKTSRDALGACLLEAHARLTESLLTCKEVAEVKERRRIRWVEPHTAHKTLLC
jgi:hypothetical protein